MTMVSQHLGMIRDDDGLLILFCMRENMVGWCG